jgi:endoglucanase
VPVFFTIPFEKGIHTSYSLIVKQITPFFILPVCVAFFSCVSQTPPVNVPLPADAISLCAVSPRIIEITIKDGHVEYGKQQHYDKQPGDSIKSEGKEVLVFRKGVLIGWLCGKERNILYTPDHIKTARISGKSLQKTRAYLLTSPEDPNYKDGIQPRTVYRKSKPHDLARIEQWRFDAPQTHICYLVFPFPFKSGVLYHLVFKNRLHPDISFHYNPGVEQSTAVHINQIGFRPDDPLKKAYLSCWMGDGGGLLYSEGLSFSVIDSESGQVFYKGKTQCTRRASEGEDGYKKNYSNTDVFEMDFSPLNREGNYIISVEGVGCSFPFPIAGNVWKQAFTVSARGFYHQRSGIELGPPWTPFLRPRAFHPDDGVVVYASTATLMETGNGLNRSDTNFGNLVKGRTKEIVPNAWGGYMDAGDWDRRIQHLDATRLLLELYEFFPDFYSDLSLSIPESENDLPDIIDEALWNLDCYRRLQVPEGGIRGGIESGEHPRHGEGSWQESLAVYTYAPCPWSSYIYAGVAARASHIMYGLGMKTSDNLALLYKKSALLAAEWAEKDGDGGYADTYSHYIRDQRNLAAAELYRLTGDERWHRMFLETTVFTESGMTLSVWQKYDQTHAPWVYLLTDSTIKDNRIARNCKSALLRVADDRITMSGRTGFGYTKDEWMPAAWSVFSSPDAVSLVRAHKLTGDKKYLVAAIQACLTGAGANPINICYTTGVGIKQPVNVLHVDARISGQPTPPGITISGPMDYAVQKEPYSRWSLNLVTPYIYPCPSKWPAIESYWDVFWFPAQCEFTIHTPMAQNAYVWGYLAGSKR